MEFRLTKRGKQNRGIYHNRMLRCEVLEDRRLLAVTNLADAGAGSLRAEIAATAPGGTITFMAGLAGVISLTSGQLQIDKNLTIDGSGASVTVSGNSMSRVFRIADADVNAFLNVTLKSLTISDGVASPAEGVRYDGGGILSFENLTLEDVTISNNSAKVNSDDDGGGISHGNEDRTGGDLILRNCILENNTSYDDAGGLDFYNSRNLTIDGTQIRNNVVGGPLAASAANVGNRVIHAGNANPNAPSQVIIRDSVMEGNNAVGSSTVDTASIGLAFLISGDAAPGWSVEISNSIISGNVDQPSPGFALSGYGALDVDSIETVVIRDSTISGNFSSSGGGGLYLGARYAPANVTLDNVTIENNGMNPSGGTPTLRGGGVYIYQGSATSTTHVTITGGIIANNHGVSGGGIFVQNGADVEIHHTTISGNTAELGGGIYANANGYGETLVTVQQSTISGNSASNAGGGVWLHADNGYVATLLLDGSTITANTSDSDTDGVGPGGGLFVKTEMGGMVTARLSNSIVSGNTDPTGTAADIYDFQAHTYGGIGYTTARFSFIGDNESSGLSEGNPNADGNIVGGSTGGVLNANLGPLANNGGTTKTHLPNAGSPVINTGDPATTGGTDQRGLARVFGGRVDMGSVEVQPGSGPDADFNDDGMLNCTDINLLTNAVANGAPIAPFDLTGDGALTIADVDRWRTDAGAVNIGAGRVYRIGDANLDGLVDGSDFGLWNSNKFTGNKDWCKGNFNADAVTDGSDFGLWNSNKFTASDAGRDPSQGRLIGDIVSFMKTDRANTARTDSGQRLDAAIGRRTKETTTNDDSISVVSRVSMAATTPVAGEPAEWKYGHFKTAETNFVAPPTPSASVQPSWPDATRSSTSRMLKRAILHDAIFSDLGAEQ